MAAVSHLAAMLLQLLCVEEFLMQMSLEKKFLTFFQFCSFMSSIFHPQFLSSKYWKQFNLKLQWKMHFGYRTPKVIISLRNIVETLTHCYCLFSSILLCHLPIVLPLCFVTLMPNSLGETSHAVMKLPTCVDHIPCQNVWFESWIFYWF